MEAIFSIGKIDARSRRVPVRPQSRTAKSYSSCADSEGADSEGSGVCATGCGLWRWRSRVTKIPTPNAELEQPMKKYKKDSENSKPRNNPVAMNSRPSRIQNCGILS